MVALRSRLSLIIIVKYKKELKTKRVRILELKKKVIACKMLTDTEDDFFYEEDKM